MIKFEGNIIDIVNKKRYSGEVYVEKGKICSIVKNNKKYKTYLLPGFVDAHVHIESSMLLPQNFSKLVKQHGTIAILNDPHEIANVIGTKGIDYMYQDAKVSDIKMYFGIPSCVPATSYDKNGAVIDALAVERLARTGKFTTLSEVMNVPGVLFKDAELCKKIEIAKSYGLQIDGHAPLLSGDDLKQYVSEGISTDHECTLYEEAEDKIKLNMMIQIREGSAACNYEALKKLLQTYPESVMFCTDDSHPNDIIHKGHIDKIVKRAVADGYDLYDVLRAASYNAIQHYKMDVGLLQEGDGADFIEVTDLKEFKVLKNIIRGVDVLLEKKEDNKIDIINNFHVNPIQKEKLRSKIENRIHGIDLLPHEIVTSEFEMSINSNTHFESDLTKDILKIVYLNRYEEASQPVVSFIRGFGLKRGAFASSIAHDSHNILAVGCSDVEICAAINSVIESKGGLSVVDGDQLEMLPLPIAGIMSDRDGQWLADRYEMLNDKLKKMGVESESPFMTLSFMSLVVIPELKIGEKGLFSYSKFSFID